MPYANNKGADVCSFNSILPIDTMFKISRIELASVAEQTGLSLAQSHNPEGRFSHDVTNIHYMSHFMRKPVFEVCVQVRVTSVCSADGTS